jgi:hypothetical protein
MYVINRKGEQEPCKFDKISERIASLSWGLSEAYCDPVRARSCCRAIVATRRGLRGRLLGVARARKEPAATKPDSPGAPRAAQVVVAQKVTAGVYKGVTTAELDELAAETAAGMTSQHPDYAVVRGCGQRSRARPRRAPPACRTLASRGRWERAVCARSRRSSARRALIRARAGCAFAAPKRL